MLNSPPSFHSGVAAFACAALQAKAGGKGGTIQPGSAGVSPVVLRVSRSTSEVVSDETSATARGTRAPPVEPAFAKASTRQAIEIENPKSEI
jgi:hypothetical protein